jgi:hypothetical protein
MQGGQIPDEIVGLKVALLSSRILVKAYELPNLLRPPAPYTGATDGSPHGAGPYIRFCRDAGALRALPLPGACDLHAHGSRYLLGAPVVGV